MSQDSNSPKDVLLSAIENLFEHPDAIELLLNNQTLNQAISNYINAAAERMAARSDWREVWSQEGETARVFNIPPEQLYDKHASPTFICTSLLKAEYAEKKQVVYIYGFVVSGLRWMPDYMSGDYRILLRVAAAVDDYGAAIELAQAQWPEVLRLFEERTEPMPVTEVQA